MPGLAEQMMGPPDFTDQFNTELTPEEEREFRKWLKKTGRFRDLADYDLRGFWKSGEAFAANGHGSDRWKKPNHPTFSNESVYSTAGNEGGRWAEAGGAWNFWASPQNVRNQSPAALTDYFRRVEPGNNVIFPFSYRLPPGLR